MKKELLHINRSGFILSQSKGFSLVEILVAISIFLVFLTAIGTITVNSSQQARHSVNKERATQLAEEALEASRNIRDADFANVTDGTYGFATSSNEFSFSGSSDTTGIFTRALTISPVNAYQKKLDVTVSWADQISETNTVTLTSYLTDWKRITPQAGITVTKNVINHGGSKVATDFAPFTVGGGAVTLGVATTTAPGTYTVTETTDSDYVLTFGGDCDSGGSVTVAEGDAKVCELTNEQRYVPVVSDPTSSGVTQTTATLGANVTSLGLPASISTRGVCYDISPAPTVNCTPEGGTTTGVFTQPITGLAAGTLYYFRGYAINAKGTGYSVDATFTTSVANVVPTVTTTAVSSVTQTTASSGGNVTSDGGASVTARGVVWSTSPNPTISLPTKTSDGTGTGSFSSSITGLTCNTLYYIRAYATNSVGTSYGSELTFTTSACSGYVIVNKIVDNTGGGTATTATFAPYEVGATTVILGASTAFAPGTYTVTETTNVNYVTTYSGDCDSSGQITVVANQTKTCTITNAYIQVEGTYTVTAPNASSYRINGQNDPTLSFQRGKRYVFNVNASGHPFWIKSGQASKVTGTANAYNTGVQNNGASVGTIIFDVPLSAPTSDLYYICEVHSPMNGNINTTP